MEERPLLTSLSNPLVKKIRGLKSRKARAEGGLFFVEGLHHVGSVLEAGWDVDALLYAPELLTGDFAHSLLDGAHRNGLAPQPVSAKVMESISGKDNPQGILAVVRQRNLTFNDLTEVHSGVALVSPQDPGNVGTILRTIDAVGSEVLFLLESKADVRSSVDIYHPTCVRASMGTLFWKPVIQSNFEIFISWARSRDIRLIGTSAHGQVDYLEIKNQASPWILVLGNEQKGLSGEEITACDVIVSLPMRGRVSSLNLSVAAGVLLYELKS